MRVKRFEKKEDLKLSSYDGQKVNRLDCEAILTEYPFEVGNLSTSPIRRVGHFSSPHSDSQILVCRRQRLGLNQVLGFAKQIK